jgi:predicted DNA-binding transcriptional regulator AlpA
LGEFPLPVELGGGQLGWYEDLIDEWVNSRPVVSWAHSNPAKAA